MTNALALVIVLVLCGTLVAVALVMAANIRPGRPVHQRPHRDRFRRMSAQPRPRRFAVVVNPTKFADLDPVKTRLEAVAAELGWAPPLFYETTPEDPGTGQTRLALASGVDLVASLGGDGTVRAVATALIGTDTPLGLLPAGTGNLLARNLELGLDDLAAATRLALQGRNRPIDVGWVSLDPPGTDTAAPDRPDGPAAEPGQVETGSPDAAVSSRRHAFLVMAGVGLDATIMAETTEEAKAKMGWSAYVATGLRNMLGPRFKVQVRVDNAEPVRAYARTVLVGNCGRITGGINLMPDAEVDDGVLDCVLLSPKGLAGWVIITARVLALDRKQGHERMARHTGLRFEITTDNPTEVQLDGDVVGEAAHVVVEVAPRALLVRVGATVGARPRPEEGAGAGG